MKVELGRASGRGSGIAVRAECAVFVHALEAELASLVWDDPM
jgi:hypothetical protein